MLCHPPNLKIFFQKNHGHWNSNISRHSIHGWDLQISKACWINLNKSFFNISLMRNEPLSHTICCFLGSNLPVKSIHFFNIMCISIALSITFRILKKNEEGHMRSLLPRSYDPMNLTCAMVLSYLPLSCGSLCLWLGDSWLAPRSPMHVHSIMTSPESDIIISEMSPGTH